MPILVIADDAAGLAAYLAPTLPGERLLAACDDSAVAAGLAAAPRAVFAIRTGAIGADACERALQAPSVRFWQTGGSGYEWMGRWDPTRLTAANAVGVLAPHLADTTLGAIVALNNGLVRYRDRQQRRDWSPRAFRALGGQRLLIVGAGAIGQAVAPRARALGLHVTGLTRRGHPLPGFDAVRPLSELDRALGAADIVSCHLRLTPETTGLFDTARFAAMVPGALFLNSARGRIVDEAALLQALAGGHLGGAWLDVFETEPLPPASALWTAPGLLITPHAADMVDGWDRRFADLFVRNLARFDRGEPVLNPIFPPG